MPDKTAIVCGHHRVSYRNFARAIEAARRYFIELRLPDRGVAVLAIESLPEGWVAGLALRSLGLTTIGVRSADQPGELGLHGIECVVTSKSEHWRELEALCAAVGWPCISMPHAISDDDSAANTPELSGLSEREGGHILLTSGTTGKYKKVLMAPESRAIQASLRRNMSGISAQSVVNIANNGCWTAIGGHFPSITWEIGGTIAFQEGNAFDSFQHGDLTHAYGTSWTLAQIFSVSEGALPRNDAMRLFLTGGPLSKDTAAETSARLTRQIYTYVSATEVGPFTLTPIERAEDLRWHRILPSREVQIVDEKERVLPPGREGLLRVRVIDGINGYVDDEDTSRVFFRDGFFYSGDLGVIGSDGRLALLGRVTDVINVLGSKFAPGPIEEAVQRELGVRGVCIFSLPQADGEEVVHVVIESPQPVNLNRLRAVLGGLLPTPFRAPVHTVPALPRNDMGKIQRNLLKLQLGLSLPE